MQPPKDFTRIIDRKRYSTATATLLAGNDWWDGHNHERRGTNQFLYRTPRGAYFLVTRTQWENQQDGLQPLSVEEAVEFYESVPPDSCRVPYSEAFTGVTIEEA